MRQEELKIQQKIMMAVGKNYPDRVRLFRNFVGTVYSPAIVEALRRLLFSGKLKEAQKMAKKIKPMRIGVIGSPDLQGFIHISGRLEYLGVEVKVPGGQQRKEQKKFQETIEYFGGHYLLCDGVDDAIEKIGNILK